MMRTLPRMIPPRTRKLKYVCLLLMTSACIVYAATIPPLPDLPIDITDIGIPNGDGDCQDQTPDPTIPPSDDSCCTDSSPTPGTPTTCDPFFGLYGRTVTVVIEGDHTLTGEFMMVCKGFLVLQNRDAGRHNVINLNKICYIELTGASG